MKRPAHQFLGLYAVTCFSLSSMWLGLSTASWFWLVLVIALASPVLLKNEMELTLSGPPQRFSLQNLAVGALLWLPVLVLFLKTYDQEFPFGGDQDHHWLMEHQMLFEVGGYLWLVPVALAFTALIARRFQWSYCLWLIGAWYLSTYFLPKEFLLRYPAGFYLLAAPLNAALGQLTADPLFANRCLNVMAIPVYAYLLRPLLVRRWPDLRLLILSAVFLLQKDWVYYFTTTYLEPWSLVFVLLSLELTLSAKTEEQDLAPFMAGLGCMFKEQAVFALALTSTHFFWRKRKAWGGWRAALTSGFSFLPFFVYYSARSNSGIWRKVEAGSLTDFLNLDQWDQYFVHLHGSLWVTGELALTLTLVAFAVAFFELKAHRLTVGLSGLLVLGSELLYFTDKQSSEYLGYPRFHLLTWPLLAIGAVLLYDERPKWRKPLTAAMATAVLLQILPTTTLLNISGGAAMARNFIEQYHAPIYFPIRELLNKLPPTSEPRELIINQPVSFSSFQYSIGFAYHRELAPFFNPTTNDVRGPASPEEPKLTRSLQCECQTRRQTVLMIDVYRPDGPEIVTSAAVLQPGQLKACAEKLRQSCGHVETIEGPDGKLVGAIAFTGEDH